MQILPNMLRIEYPGDLDNKNPTADIPYKWGDQFPVIHANLIIPSAHMVNGKRFDAEYQVWVMSEKQKRGGRGAAVIAALVDVADKESGGDGDIGHNTHLQVAIDGWQSVFNLDKKKGGGGKEHSPRELYVDRDKDGGGDNPVRDEVRKLGDNEGIGRDEEHREEGPSHQHGWNPFHKSLLPSYYWWGYEGTTMEPPCYPIVEYRITDTPATISFNQMTKLKELLFEHCVYDDNDPDKCVYKSNHHNEDASRPVQPTHKRDLHRCSCMDFYSDKLKRGCPEDSKKRSGKCPRSCRGDKAHEWYKMGCPPYFGDECPKWYEGR